MRDILTIAIAILMLASCGKQGSQPCAVTESEENREAKVLLQGIWLDDETGEVSFRAIGDTIFYPDTLSQPSYFRVIDDSLELSGRRYAIVKQGEYFFWFKNPSGDVVKLSKSDDPLNELAFKHEKPQGITTYTSVVNRDSVIMFEGERYHWYITINPTKYKVISTSYNDDGVGVDNIYYDNIIHVSLFQGARRVYSSDFRKQQYSKLVPSGFLEQAVMTNMEYDHADAEGFHFNATVCKTDGVSCYLVGITITKAGSVSMKLLEY